MQSKTRFKKTEIGKISEDWKKKILGEEIELCYGKGLPKSKRNFGVTPVFGSNGIVGYHNDSLAKGPGIIVGRKGSVGEVKFSKDDFWAIDTTYFVKLKRKGDIHFWYYLLLTLKLTKMNSHSAVPGLNRDNVYGLLKRIPNLEDQQCITKILSDLDSRIELNQEMNKTLEAIGQTLFKRWFVDFEFPNDEGKPYKSNGGEMFDSEIGKIPKEWKITELKECGDIICGKTPPTKDKDNYGVDVPFITIPDMRGKVFAIKTERKLSLVGAKTQTKKELPPLSICVSCIATPGIVVLTSETSYTNQQINSIVCKREISPYFIYLIMSKMSEQIKLLGLGGTATLNLNTGNFSKIKVIYPSTQVMKTFHAKMKAIFDKILLNVKEMNMLFQVRDSLLPRLMSGKIRVRR